MLIPWYRMIQQVAYCIILASSTVLTPAFAAQKLDELIGFCQYFVGINTDYR